MSPNMPEIEETIKCKVLAVDDLKENLIALESILEKMDVEVVSETSPEKALKLLLKEEFALALVDVNMPEINGFEMAEMMRSNSNTSKIPIIFITADYTDKLSVFKGYDLGAIDYILKPIDPAILCSKVRVFSQLYIENKTNYKKLYMDLLNTKNQLQKSNDKLHYLATYDALTSVMTRFAFDKFAVSFVSLSKRNKRQFALLSLDIDKFKYVNDNYGHDIGDIVLKSMTNTIRKVLREEDIFGRYGGDEFAILLTEIKSAKDAATVAEKIIKTVSDTPVIANGHSIPLRLSIGIAYTNYNYQLLVKHADIAMYHAKDEGRSCYRFYSDAVGKKYNSDIIIGNELQNAIKNNEFYMHYQPIVNIATGKIVGAEALIRWKNDKFPKIGPAEFIPIAEERGLIRDIELWMINTACKQFEEWNKKDIFLSVNLSSYQLEKQENIQSINAILSEHKVKISYENIEFELTESGTALLSSAKNIKTLEKFKFPLAIDDFGSGYSSLSRLFKLPIKTIKIDGSFISEIKDPKGQAIIKSIIFLGSNLSVKIIAEHVETKEQADLLRSFGCSLAQGYYYSPPLPADGIKKIMDKQ